MTAGSIDKVLHVKDGFRAISRFIDQSIEDFLSDLALTDKYLAGDDLLLFARKLSPRIRVLYRVSGSG